MRNLYEKALRDEEEHDPDSEEKSSASSGWGILLLGMGALAGLAWWVGRQPSAEAQPPSPPSPPQPGQLPTGAQSSAAAAAAAASAIEAALRGMGQPTSPSTPTATPQGGAVTYLGNPITLQPGTRYRARLLLSGLEKLGSAAQIAAQFEALGFQNVRVYMKPSEVPSGWPTETLQNPSDGTRWLEGTFAGPAASLPKPPQIEKVWV